MAHTDLAEMPDRGEMGPVFQAWAGIAGIGILVLQGPDVVASNQAAKDILGEHPRSFEWQDIPSASAPVLAEWPRRHGECTVEVQRVPGEYAGRPAQYLFIRDVTMELDAIRRSSRLLADLAGANENLETFTRAATHDLRGPLRSIQGFAQLLRRRLGPETHAAEHRLVEAIWDSSRRMDDLIDGLAQLASVGSHLERRPVDLNMTIGEVLADLSWELDGSHVDVGPMPTVQGDPRLLRQLLQNLIGNALKYRRTDTEHRVTIECEVDGACVLHVADNGVGFDPQQAPRLFRPFERLAATQTVPGSGIGLATCKRIVELHGGSIRATAEPGLGARFTVSLPA